MKRSEFLRLAGLGLMYPLVKSLSSFQSPGNTSKKVIIVGAGMAGISAGRALTDMGIPCIILEARDRIGGRVFSDSSLGTTLDFGASWIHEKKGNPILALANKYKIETRDTNYDSISAWHYKGEKIAEEQLYRIYKKSQKLLRRAIRINGRKDYDPPFSEGLTRALQEMAYQGRELEEILWRISTEELNAAVEFEMLSGWGDKEKGYGGGDSLFPGGYHQVINQLSIKLNIKTGSPVYEIVQNNQGVSVKTQEKTYEGSHCLVTVPLGVLKAGKINFIPALSQRKKDAIAGLQMGNLNKIGLKMEKVSWPSDKHFLGYVSEKKGNFPVFLNWAQYTGKPFLIAFAGYKLSEKLDTLNESQIRSEISKPLELLAGKNTIEALKYSAWKKDPLAFGSYSVLPPGISGKKFDDLSISEGKIHFAGEATIRGQNGTVHGAYLSGIREAEKLKKL